MERKKEKGKKRGTVERKEKWKEKGGNVKGQGRKGKGQRGPPIHISGKATVHVH